MDPTLIILFAAVVVIAALLFALITFGKHGSLLDVEKYRTRWLTVEQSLERDNEASFYKAIIDADKLVDQALKETGYKGQTMGDRIKSARGKLPHRNELWAAHKLRNKIAHEEDVKVNYDQARRALASFKLTLKDLGAI